MTRHMYRVPAVGLALLVLLSLGLTQSVQSVQAAASLTLARSTVPQGAVVPVSGSGFTAGDTATLAVDVRASGSTQHVQATAPVNGNGSFSGRLTLPRATAPAVYTLTAKDTHGISAKTNLTVLPLIVLRVGGGSASATVLAHRPFFIDAFGFAAHETVKLQATFHTYSGNDVVVTRTPTANANGTVVEATMSPPAEAKVGWAQLTATGATDNKTASGRVYVVYHPYIVLKSASVTSGSSAVVYGRNFVAHGQVHLQITINSANGPQTLSVDAQADGNGNFTKYVRIPAYTSAGSYTVTATDASTTMKVNAKLTVGTAQPKPAPAQASVSVEPKMTLPNEYVTFTGKNYPANTSVTVTSTVDIRGGGNRTITKSTTTDKSGAFAVYFSVPYKAAPGTYDVTAAAGNTRATDQLEVLPLSRHPRGLNFRWVSLWYHTVQRGTYDQLVIQSTLGTTLGIWVHIIFPSGAHYDYYTNTDASGHWSKRFGIPRNGLSRHSNQAYVTLQLWHGNQTTQSFVNFTLV